MKKNIIAIVIGAVLLVGGYVGVSYNALMSANENVESQFATIESKLQRRYDLIPNLVNSVQGSMKHEEKVFTELADARAKLAGASNTNEKIEATNELEGSLSRLLMVVENYPNLKANENVKGLMDELAGTENRISVERDRFSKEVKGYNKKIKRFPTNMIANMFGFEEKEYFKSTEGADKAPTVNLN